MNTRYETAPRATAAGVTTAAILLVTLAMGVSTLFPESAPAPTAVAGHDGPVQVVRAAGTPVRNS